MTEPDAPLWAGRFTTPPDPAAVALGRSLSFDVRLAPYDVEAGVAHVRALEESGLVTAAEAGQLEKALRDMGEEIAAGTFAFDAADEDVHSAIERGVIERLGDVGAKLHAGRSRNDLVMTDLRLWLLDAEGRIRDVIERCGRALLEHAHEHAETVMPGTTHARFAQPVTLGHHLLAHAWALVRDLDRFGEWRRRASVSPLGAGALATSTLRLDHDGAARRLGFEDRFANSIDAVSDRDVVQEFLGCASICATHLSRLAADVTRFSDESLGWATIDEAFATGSSMMPQKRNPDVAELARAKAGRVLGDFVGLATVLHGLPLGYHRDLQEDKEAVFDAVDTLEASAAALAGCVATLTFHPDAMRRAAEAAGLYATDVAEALVESGVPFREAHERVGALITSLERGGRSLRDLSADEWAALGAPNGGELLDPDRSVRARAAPGGPSPGSVREQIAHLERALGPGVRGPSSERA